MKDYAEDLFRLLATYESISASEAASRVNIHIKTTQDFLEDLYGLGILDRDEVYEGKRPYFRYRLKVKQLTIQINLEPFSGDEPVTDTRLNLKIREKKNTGMRFTTSRSNDYISNVVVWVGDPDHFSVKDIKKTEKPKTRIICPKSEAKKLGDFDFKIRDLKPGDSFYQDKNLKVIAVDTYNLNSTLIWLKIHIKIIETSDIF